MSIDLAIEVSEHFCINKNEALEIANVMLVTVRDNWRKVAQGNGLSKSSIEYMRLAFSATQI